MGGQETHKQGIVSLVEVKGFGWRKSVANQAETVKLGMFPPPTPPSISQGMGISTEHPRYSLAYKTFHQRLQCDFSLRQQTGAYFLRERKYVEYPPETVDF